MSSRIYSTIILESLVCIALAKEAIFNKIVDTSRDFGVPEGQLYYVVEHESQFNNCAIGDTKLEKPSLGLVQISMKYHPEVTPSMAMNASFALDFLATGIRNGKCSQWTTCRAWLRLYRQPVSDG